MRTGWIRIAPWALMGAALVGLCCAPLAAWLWYVLAAGMLWVLAAHRRAIAKWFAQARKRKGSMLKALLLLGAAVILFTVVYGDARGKAVQNQALKTSAPSGAKDAPLTLDSFAALGTTGAAGTAGITGVTSAPKQPTLCFPCHGDGACSLCDGKGRLHIGTVAERVCPSCAGYGVCAFCHGTGFLD